MIGLDGATFSILDPMMEAGVMPFLSELTAQGVRAELKSTIPHTTPPAWTTIMTGRSPANHGILDFFRPESPGSRFLRFVNTKQLKCETIWSYLTRKNMSCISLNFPVMSPPLAINGYSIPGFVTWRHLRRACHPENLMDQLKSIPDFDLKIIAHDFGLEEKVVEGCSPNESEEWIKYHTYKDQQWALVLDYLAKQRQSQLQAIVLDSPDRLQHIFYRLLDPQCFPKGLSKEDEQLREILVDHYRKLDSMMAEMVKNAGPDTTVFIVSDHGFGPSEECFYLNTLLEQMGYLSWSDRAVSDEDGSGDVSMDAVRNHGHMLDWDNTIAYVNTPSSNGITINIEGKNSQYGIKPEAYEQFRDKLKAQLLNVTHPKTGRPLVKNIWTREEAFDNTELAPDLTLSLWDNGLVSTVKSQHIVKKRTEIIGVHYPMGVFMAKGPGIKSGKQLDALDILDVAPAMLYAAGLPIPQEYEGRVPEEMMTPDALSAKPVIRETSSAAFEQQTMSSLEMDDEDMDLIFKRLKGLGYLD